MCARSVKECVQIKIKKVRVGNELPIPERVLLLVALSSSFEFVDFVDNKNKRKFI